MRPLGAIAAIVLLAGMMPATSYADGPGPGAAPEAAKPGCRCPGVRHVRHYVRHRAYHARLRRGILVVPTVPVAAYDPPLPSPWDTAYDRGMTLHFESAAVSRTYTGEPGWPPLPAIRSVGPYRKQVGGVVLQYDGMIGEYVQLAQADAHMVLLPPPPAAPAPPPAAVPVPPPAPPPPAAPPAP